MNCTTSVDHSLLYSVIHMIVMLNLINRAILSAILFVISFFSNKQSLSIDLQKGNDYQRRKRAAPEYESSHQAKTKKNRNKSFTLPISGGLRWKGLSMAHVRSRDGVDVRERRATREQGKGDVEGVARTLTVVFILGGTIFVLLLGIILLFAIW